MKTKEDYIYRCINLALKGSPYVSPNPMVGAVLVKKGKIIGEGYHRKFGSHHAEVNAINSALKKGYDLKGSVMYVNLEPCSHSGKTPPCVDLIIASGIKEVVIGTKDPNPLVSGKGIRKLKKAGIKVTSGVLEYECMKLNRFFFKYITTGLPYIILKTAQTLDGKIADSKGNSKWITSLESRKFAHLIRSKVDAVLIGKNTAEIDNPSLTVRLTRGRNPMRIIVSKTLIVNKKLKLFSDREKSKTILLTASGNESTIKKLSNKGFKILTCKISNGIIDLRDAMRELARIGISSVLVEGGSYTHSEFLRQGLCDELMIFIAPKIMGEGLSSFSFGNNFYGFKEINPFKLGQDILINIIK